MLNIWCVGNEMKRTKKKKTRMCDPRELGHHRNRVVGFMKLKMHNKMSPKICWRGGGEEEKK